MSSPSEGDPPARVGETEPGFAGRVSFEPSGIGGTVAVLRHGGAIARVALFGGQVIDWQPVGQAPVLWLSPLARLDGGKAVRGGVPICWPWFGPASAELAAATGRAWPQHGFARTAMWSVDGSGGDASGVWIRLALESPEEAGSGWPGAASVSLTVRLAATLDLELETRNRGVAPIELTQALHTYFQVSDIETVRVEGLDGHVFHDAVALGPATAVSAALRSQVGGVTIGGEVDRVYLEQRGAVRVVDHGLSRQIVIDKLGSASTVVWNPGPAKGEALGDLGPDGWRGMVCVEAANTVYDGVTVMPGATALIGASYAVTPI